MILTAAASLEELIAGNNRFLEGQSIRSSEASLRKLKDFAKKGQLPKAIILCCSDSRAPVETIFDQDIGDLFVIRVAGNILAPSLIGSVEFAASTFGTKLVLVMGHTQCGAIEATLQHIRDSDIIRSENIYDIVARIEPHILSVTRLPGLTLEQISQKAVEANVRATVEQLSQSSRLIEGLLRDGKISIRGSVLNLASGRVALLENEVA